MTAFTSAYCWRWSLYCGQYYGVHFCMLLVLVSVLYGGQYDGVHFCILLVLVTVLYSGQYDGVHF